jgi:selenocysteine lyase/cysteine desulfurase
VHTYTHGHHTAVTPSQVHAKSTLKHRWLVVVDAAAHVPTHHLNLTRYKPDFVPLSFYKVFGFPTGARAVRLRVGERLRFQAALPRVRG